MTLARFGSLTVAPDSNYGAALRSCTHEVRKNGVLLGMFRPEERAAQFARNVPGAVVVERKR